MAAISVGARSSSRRIRSWRPSVPNCAVHICRSSGRTFTSIRSTWPASVSSALIAARKASSSPRSSSQRRGRWPSSTSSSAGTRQRRSKRFRASRGRCFLVVCRCRCGGWCGGWDCIPMALAAPTFLAPLASASSPRWERPDCICCRRLRPRSITARSGPKDRSTCGWFTIIACSMARPVARALQAIEDVMHTQIRQELLENARPSAAVRSEDQTLVSVA